MIAWFERVVKLRFPFILPNIVVVRNCRIFADIFPLPLHSNYATVNTTSDQLIALAEKPTYSFSMNSIMKKHPQENSKKEIDGIPYDKLELFARNIYPYILKDLKKGTESDDTSKSVPLR